MPINQPPSSKRRGLPSRASDPQHEKLLLIARRDVSVFLANEFDPNEALKRRFHECKDHLTNDVEQRISRVETSAEEASQYRRFCTTEPGAVDQPRRPNVELGVHLVNRFSNTGKFLSSPVTLYSADLAVAFWRPKWSHAHSSALRRRAVGGPTEPGRYVWRDEGATTVLYGAVFTTATTLGTAAAELAEMASSVDAHNRVYAGHGNVDPSPLKGRDHVFFVTDSPVIWEGLVPQYAGCFVEEGRITQYFLKLDGINAKSSIKNLAS